MEHAMNRRTVIDTAKKLRGQYFTDGIKNPRDAFERIFDEKGIRLEYSDDCERIHRDDNGEWIIEVPCTSSPLRDNFTIAHELGHLFLHKTEESKEFHRSGEPKTEEVEANIFAAEFLMPEDEFKNKAKEFNNSERMLASYFGVSPVAALVRMAVLNIDKN